MQLTNLLHEDRAVSPVIGVILMVAITVILSAVIGTFVVGVGETQSGPPQATLYWGYNAADGTVSVTHGGGEQFTQRNSHSIRIVTPHATDGGTDNWLAAEPDDRIAPGDRFVIDDDTDPAPPDMNVDAPLSSGDEVRVVWTAPGGGRSTTIAEFPIS